MGNHPFFVFLHFKKNLKRLSFATMKIRLIFVNEK